MIKIAKQCQNCHLDVDIDPTNPPSLCPFCGKEMLYSIEETKQIKLAEKIIEEKSDASNERALSSKTSKEIIVFTPAKTGNKYKKIAIGLAAILIVFLGYFVVNHFVSKNTQTAVSQNVSYEVADNNKPNTPVQKSTATPTKAPTPTATPIKQIQAPALAEQFIGMDYKDVEENFRNAGFKNIKTRPLKDMLIDIGGTHIGDVQSISIRGNINYDTKTLYNETDVVIIYYHSLKK